jgi:diguanylate cyclase (GGDEF)-like protein
VRALFNPARSIKSFILTAAVLVSLALFGVSYLVVSKVYDQSLRQDARQVARIVSGQVFSAMYQVMSRGWSREELEQFLAGLRDSTDDTSYSLEIYRGPLVSARYGEIEQPALDASLETLFRDGQRLTLHQAGGIRDLFPLRASAVCLKCHGNAEVGDTLGVIEFRQDLRPTLEKARSQFLTVFALLAPLPLVVAFLVALFITRRIEVPLAGLRNHIGNINRVADLRALSDATPRPAFHELRQVFDEVTTLVTKLRDVAVDKDLLEFEIRLLERFVITSDVVRDWQDYVRQLLLEINQIIPTYALFSVFKVDSEVFDLEVFWYSPPGGDTRDVLEHVAREALDGHPRFVGSPIDRVNHHVARTHVEPLQLTAEDLRVQVKSLIVDEPKIGGIVGVGVHAELADDPTRALVVDSILSTLLNVIGSVKAISKYTKDLEYYATRDPLTNLYNQRVFRELMEYETGRAERHGHRFALLVIDLDNFKSINDSFGHLVGDKFLQSFAGTIKSGLRVGDIFARYGGDEFVILLNELDEDSPYVAAERILEAADSVLYTTDENEPVRASVSIGVGIYPDHADNANDLFLFADHMMYKAKSQGKHRLAIPDQDDLLETFREISEKTQLVTQAVEERWVVPFFQPIVESGDGTIHAYEVLSRIRLPDGRLVAAGEFIEVAERLGIIHKLDLIVMEKAFSLAAEQGYDGLLFVNLSPKALVLNEFFDGIRGRVEAAGLRPEQIVFELTERDTVRNVGMLEQFVNRLHLDGYKFAIDDFGSGFSSFHYIKRFPVDYIKIEGDFIANMINDHRDMAFVQSIALLARQLGICTIGEFVESAEVMTAVADAGIDYSQGYHIGKPSPLLQPDSVVVADDA